MSIATVVDIGRLDAGRILAPERYDPRRRRARDAGPCVGDFVQARRDTVAANAEAARRYLVFDTGDAKDGVLTARKPPIAGSELRSAKKRIRPRQVVISRLRPYLRQVAWADACLLAEQPPGTELICSTEFFVLESVDSVSVAFLVPFLLSAPIQAVLAAAQEGGHHPRFNERTLMTLPIPPALVRRAPELSADVERAVDQARAAYAAVRGAIATAAQLQPTAAGQGPNRGKHVAAGAPVPDRRAAAESNR